MALGSPCQNPLPPLPVEAAPNIAFFVDSPPAPYSTNTHTAENEDTMKQKGKWKMFGGFFGKKNASTPASPASAFYQLQPEIPPAPHTGVKPPQPYHKSNREAGKPRKVGSHSKSRETGRDSSGKPRTHPKDQGVNTKPDIQRAHTAPMFQSERKSPTPPPKDYKVQRDSSRARSGDGPMMLQVEIPNFTMERYSVMFGNVLRPQQPSLLVRRKAQLEKLKSAVKDEHYLVDPHAKPQTYCGLADMEQAEQDKDDAGLLRPQQRSTSPSPQAKSPYFSLFPPTTPSANGTLSPLPLHKSTSLQRSATVPNTSSPMRPTFELTKSTIDEQNAVVVMVRSPFQSSATPASSHKPKWSSDFSSASTEASTADGYDLESSPQDTRLTSVKLLSPQLSSQINTVPTDFKLASPPAKHRRNPKPAPIIDDTPKASVPIHLKSPPKFHPPTSAFSINGKSKPTVTNERVGSIKDTKPPSVLPRSAAEISVARQISLSRKQRQLLVPIVPKTARQPMQPKLVSVNGEGKEEGEWKAVASRKSHHLIIEDA